LAESSFLWTTNGTGDGTGTGYTQANASDIFEIVSQCFGRNGVAANYLNGLAPSTTGVNNARIATGGALVDGKPYKNTANVDVTIPSAVGGGNTRIDRVVLRASWAAQTVRVTRIAGTDAASPTAPAITQTSGTTYDVMLCQALVDTAGTVTITDERTLAQVDTSEIADLAVTTAKLRTSPAMSVLGRASVSGSPDDLTATVDGYVLRRNASALGFGQITIDSIPNLLITSGKLAADSVIAGKIADGAVDTAGRLASNVVTTVKILDDNVTAAKIADGAIDATAKLANDIVDDTKVGSRVPQFYRRQGGSATNWMTEGASNYTPTTIRVQWGAVAVPIVNGQRSGSAAITFPVAFSDVPWIMVACITSGGANGQLVGTVGSPTASGFTAGANREGTAADVSYVLVWLSIGPE